MSQNNDDNFEDDMPFWRFKKMKELSLFTGMGGGIYGSLILGWQTVCYVEKDNYCQSLIKQRINDGWFDNAPILGDITEFNKKEVLNYAGNVDIITGGFPCQPFSVAGKRKGENDQRYLFDEIIKTIKIVQPKRLFFENVPGILSDPAIVKIYQSLGKIGYRCKPPLLLGSDDCGAIHRRKRVWIYATNGGWSQGKRQQSDSGKILQSTKAKINCKRIGGEECRFANCWCKRGKREPSLQRSEKIREVEDLFNRSSVPKPLLCRVDDAFADRVKRLKAVGNAQDPIVMATAYNLLSDSR